MYDKGDWGRDSIMFILYSEGSVMPMLLSEN